MPRVLITGCSTGIGRATAILMSEKGYEVVATARRVETLDDLDVSLKLQLDVDRNDSVAAAVEAAGDIHILINNAAWEVAGPVESVPLDRIRAMFETNVFGALRLVQAYAPGFRAKGAGCIVNVSSTVGRFALPLSGTYSATKHALEALSEALHYELAHFGIRVVVVEPGGVDTAWPSNEEWHGIDRPPYDELNRQMYGRRNEEQLPPAEEVAGVILQAIESEEHRLRWHATPAAHRLLVARSSMDDPEWKAALRAGLGLNW